MFKYDMVRNLKDGGTFLLNTTFSRRRSCIICRTA